MRIWLPALVVLLLGWLCSALAEPHSIRALDAPQQSFSAMRARRVLVSLLGAEQPHPVGSAEDDAVQARIAAQFRALGIPVHAYRAFVCNAWRGFSFIPCATVNDLLAEIRPGSGRAVLMLAHSDSVPAGPGAADDGAGVACVLEAARALRAQHPKALARPVMALISDGEEAGLLGAAAFLQNRGLAARVGAAVNVEARGTHGASLLFQTSPGDARLVQLYATHVHFSAASSLFAFIYQHLPNDTDLTLFIRRDIPAVNFAFAEGVQAYHSPLDRLSHLSLASLQMQGDNLLAMTAALADAPLENLAGPDALYVSTLGYFLPRMPRRAALPLAVLVLLLVGAAVLRAHRAGNLARVPGASPPSLARCLAGPPAMIAGSVLLGEMLALIGRAIAGVADPSYAHPQALRMALELLLWGVLLLCASRGSAPQWMAASWLWIALLALLAALGLPGLVPYLLWPAAIAGVLLWFSAGTPGAWQGRWSLAAAATAALAMLMLWLPLADESVALLGLQVPAVFTLSASIGLTTLLPLLAPPRLPAPSQSPRALRASAGICAAGALLFAVVAGLQPPYSAAAPERLNLLYFEDDQGARWIADTAWQTNGAAPLPPSLARAAPFHRQALTLPGLSRAEGYVAPAGPPRLPLPRAQIGLQASSSGPRQVTVHLLGSDQTDEMALYLPAGAAVQSLEIRGQRLAAPADWSGTTALLCMSRDCRDETVTLRLAGARGVTVQFVEHRYGLPAFGDALRAARAGRAMPSQAGDEVLLAGKVLVP
ncbi:MAG TPA: M20/M25/M40 family metallo-hydrolase [Steroidobacteraceae bacterium]|nr:M20/M25/M40 family metallo-hydrolase [Steroidobacteraceae bacterium]